MITLIHMNPVELVGDKLRVDRKFHTGMLDYAGAINSRVLSVNPARQRSQSIMDAVELPVADLPYGVLALDTDTNGVPTAAAFEKLNRQIAGSLLVVGYGYNAARTAEKNAKRYIPVIEYDLHTQLVASNFSSKGILRGARSFVSVLKEYFGRMLPAIKSGYQVHCNGYPIFNVARKYNQNSILYLDSRIYRDMIITEAELERRLQERRGRPLRLLFSGRFVEMKGALDAVKAVALCLAAGLDVELDCYGSGVLQDEMQQAAGASKGAIRIWDEVPFS